MSKGVHVASYLDKRYSALVDGVNRRIAKLEAELVVLKARSAILSKNFNLKG